MQPCTSAIPLHFTLFAIFIEPKRQKREKTQQQHTAPYFYLDAMPNATHLLSLFLIHFGAATRERRTRASVFFFFFSISFQVFYWANPRIYLQCTSNLIINVPTCASVVRALQVFANKSTISFMPTKIGFACFFFIFKTSTCCKNPLIAAIWNFLFSCMWNQIYFAEWKKDEKNMILLKLILLCVWHPGHPLSCLEIRIVWNVRKGDAKRPQLKQI